MRNMKDFYCCAVRSYDLMLFILFKLSGEQLAAQEISSGERTPDSTGIK
jgi:hypothetical protein